MFVCSMCYVLTESGTCGCQIKTILISNLIFRQLTEFYILAFGYQVILFMVTWSHLMCLFSNPGIVDFKTELWKAKMHRESSNVCKSPCEIDCKIQIDLMNYFTFYYYYY